MNNIIWCLSGIIGILIFFFIKDYFVKKIIKTIPNFVGEIGTETIINGVKKEIELFDWKKFRQGFFDVTNPVQWSKDLVGIFNLRKLIIVGVIIAGVYGYGWWKGRITAPVHIIGFEKVVGKIIDVNHKSNKAIRFEADGTISNLTKQPDGTYKVEGKIDLTNIPELAKAIRPYGFQLKPIGVAGVSLGLDKSKLEAGGGVSWFRYYNFNLDSFLTNVGIYPVGVSYTLSKVGEGNTAVGVGLGKGWKSKDNRIIGYFRWKF